MRIKITVVFVLLLTAQSCWAATVPQAYTLGDSITFNQYVPVGQPKWPDLEARAYPWMHFTNLGLPGAKTVYILEDGVPKVIASPACKLVVIGAGVNDLEVTKPSEVTPPATQEQEYLAIVDAIQAKCPNATIVVSTYVNDYPDGSPAWEGYTDFRYTDLVRLNNFVRAVPFLRATYPIVVCDIAADARFVPFRPGDESPYMINAIHENAAGQYPYAQDEEACLTSVDFRR